MQELWWPSFVAATEVGRLAFFGLLYPLYTRLTKDKLLENFTRGRIYGHIEANPGIHYSELLRALKLSNGTLAYHLKTLEREGLVRSIREGQLKLFYPKVGEWKSKERKKSTFFQRKKDAEKISITGKEILESVKQNPGLTEAEICSLTGLSKQVVNYHIRKLEKTGVMRVEREGGRARCFFRENERLQTGEEGPVSVNQ